MPRNSSGRLNQKARARDALVAAARGLLARGVVPTMEGIAAAAAMSRSSAYRYFPNLAALLVAAYPHVEAQSLLGPDPPHDAEARLEIVAADQARRILIYEPEMRAVLRLSLEPDAASLGLPMHRGLRIGWIEDALAPLRGRMHDDELRRLVIGIGASLGIEAFVWLTDIARVPREEAAVIIRTNALRLLRSALRELGRPE